MAYQADGGLDVRLFLMVLLGAVSAHISVNAFNEYADFRSGLDALTLRTPFSGGDAGDRGGRAVAHHRHRRLFHDIPRTRIVASGHRRGSRGAHLTPWINRNPWLCLLAPGLGFGTLMVMGTVYVLSGRYSSAAFAASMVPFFLVNALLLLNQFPDVEADRRVGRRNLPILYGRRVASRVFGLLVLLSFVGLLAAVHASLLPRASLVGLIGLIAAVSLVRGVYRNADHIGALLPYMALNVALTVITPVLVAAGVWLAA